MHSGKAAGVGLSTATTRARVFFKNLQDGLGCCAERGRWYLVQHAQLCAVQSLSCEAASIEGLRAADPSEGYNRQRESYPSEGSRSGCPRCFSFSVSRRHSDRQLEVFFHRRRDGVAVVHVELIENGLNITGL